MWPGCSAASFSSASRDADADGYILPRSRIAKSAIQPQPTMMRPSPKSPSRIDPQTEPLPYIGNLSLRKYQERERSEQVFSCSLFPNGYSPPEFTCWETLASLFSTGYNHPERAVGKHKGN